MNLSILTEKHSNKSRKDKLPDLDVGRRRFIFGNFRQNQEPACLRPPWAVAEHDFINICSRCHKCIEHCETSIIRKDGNGLPVVDFKQGGCTFCKRCVEVCEDKALNMDQSTTLPWEPAVTISDKCLSLRKVTCRSCGDSCEENAITFRYQPGGLSQPEINASSCTACGFCVQPCPVDAINISYKEYQQ